MNVLDFPDDVLVCVLAPFLPNNALVVCKALKARLTDAYDKRNEFAVYWISCKQSIGGFRFTDDCEHHQTAPLITNFAAWPKLVKIFIEEAELCEACVWSIFDMAARSRNLCTMFLTVELPGVPDDILAWTHWLAWENPSIQTITVNTAEFGHDGDHAWWEEETQHCAVSIRWNN